MGTFTVSANEAGARIDKVLAGRPDVASRSAAQRLVAEGQVRINERTCAKHDIVRAGDLVGYRVPPPRDSHIEPEPIPLDVRYEDADVLVVSKPAGRVVHPAHGHHSMTLVNALLHHCPDLSGIGGERRPGIVHRLDKDTSGLLIVAKNDAAHASLSDQLRRRTIKRTYLALVHGTVPLDEGVIDAAIGRSTRDRKKMAVAVGGRAARTRYKVVERMKSYTLLELSLETGRTHQVRVHLAHIGHPVVGDGQYGPTKKSGLLGLNRQFLHATGLAFVHPCSGKHIELSDELPPELERALDCAREG